MSSYFQFRTIVRLTPKGLGTLKSAVLEKNISYREMSERLGISTSTIIRFSKGTPISCSNAMKILRSLCLSEDESLLEEVPQEQVTRAINRAVDQSVFDRNATIVSTAAQELSEVPVDDVQSIASTQIKILDNYYREGLTQARNSFRWASVASATGFFFFLASVVLVLRDQPRDKALIPLLSGTCIEVVAGINFYLYGRASKQLSTFQRNLEQTQRFLLANSICESLDRNSREAARSELVKTVSSTIP